MNLAGCDELNAPFCSQCQVGDDTYCEECASNASSTSQTGGISRVSSFQ